MKQLLIWFLTCMTTTILLVGCTTEGKQTKESKQTQEQTQEDNYRIVSTTVAITEVLDALEINIVGKPTSYKTLPERYDNVEEIGNPKKPDMEIVRSLDPTHLLSVTTIEDMVEPVLEGSEIEGTYLDFSSIEGMQDSILQLGETFNREQQATKLFARYDKKKAEIQTLIKDEKSPKVLILMGVPGSYLVATEHSYIGDLVKLAGGTNVIQGDEREYLASNTEYLHRVKPDVILRAPHGFPEQVKEMFNKEFKENDIWKHFKAVQNDRVYDLEEKIFGITAGIRADEALDELVNMLYPNLNE
ncbi:heme ABC transporter substrate-binding protein [Pontibacillus litoralis JSM 072002]|uniref:High-affinity heme uptake system protein IsdE n=2 Tax=Pontibacillus TaxID=289201 RepID=A0A0A5G513_9BACI|nr:heme ABC transporter substrate-binding protein IsdE [Pontibacillus litoralis]KGX86243.1 heme ABC transporter substrate-binding protein [Pontibacillus litoralis JSM 072002]